MRVASLTAILIYGAVVAAVKRNLGSIAPLGLKSDSVVEGVGYLITDGATGVDAYTPAASLGSLTERDTVCPTQAPLACPNSNQCCPNAYPRCCTRLNRCCAPDRVYCCQVNDLKLCCPQGYPYCGATGRCYQGPPPDPNDPFGEPGVPG